MSCLTINLIVLAAKVKQLCISKLWMGLLKKPKLLVGALNLSVNTTVLVVFQAYVQWVY